MLNISQEIFWDFQRNSNSLTDRLWYVMQYSPLASGIGLLIAGNGLPEGPGLLLLARILLDIAGLCFIAFALFFAFADLSGRVRRIGSDGAAAKYQRSPRHLAQVLSRYPRHLARGLKGKGSASGRFKG